MISFRHIDTQQILNTVKFSIDSTNSIYFLHSSPDTQVQGTPDINYEDVCFIKPTGQIYTHGKLYGGDSLIDQIPLATTTTKGLMSAEDKSKIEIFNTSNFNFSTNNIQEACKTLISTINNTLKNDKYQLFDGTFGANNLYMYHGCAYPNFDMLQYSAFLIMSVATGSLYKCGYTAGNWYFSNNITI